MFLVPPRQKDTGGLPAWGLPKSDGAVWGSETSPLKRQRHVMVKVALCLYYMCIFNDVHLFSDLKVI